MFRSVALRGVSPRYYELLERRAETAVLLEDLADELSSSQRSCLRRDPAKTRLLRAVLMALATVELEREIEEAADSLECDIQYIAQLQALLKQARRRDRVVLILKRLDGLRSAVDEIEAELAVP